MTRLEVFGRRTVLSLLAAALVCVGGVAATPAAAQVTAFKQAVAEAASTDEEIAAFYRGNGYQPIWTSETGPDRDRRAEFLAAIARAEDHGLPVSRYDPEGLRARLRAVRTPRDLGLVEVEMSRMFVRYARDLQTGLLDPRQVDHRIVREVPYRSRTTYLVEFAQTSPRGYLRQLPPQTLEYNALLKQKLAMERQIHAGGWGATVPAAALKPGEVGNAVALLRNRLIAMGYLARTNTQVYDSAMESAVQQFQLAHGLEADGVAGEGTMAEINRSAESRLQSIIVAMERERWLNQERGARHILVNIPDFTAKIIDHGKVTFETRTVVGANQSDRLTPEFSDVMEFMVINPSWHVPRSIATKEYLPALRRNPGAARHLVITDRRGRTVDRGSVDFSQYTERNFPFSMRQPPSNSNALGLVKFMFPNKHNIYLHDTPAKNLFSREIRAYSHGCIRLNDPFDFAYALLARQSDDPKGLFHGKLRTGAETRLNLEEPVPVHIIYRTAFTDPRGRMNYRRDVYGRDGRIWDALSKAGVALRSVQG